ncbi:Shiga-like toxin beta subunit [Burkholderia cenocepacia]|uniref:Shiga-like toxin beta subunit n=1 Tax=Burkholderia cenocepacia TaxID=95486 RepID=UPI00396B388B
MKTLKYFILSLLFSAIPAASALAEIVTSPPCVVGPITTFNHNNDNTVSISVGKYVDLYTDRASLEPLLFTAFLTGSAVEIRTTACKNKGGFSEVNFKNQ